MIDDEDVLPLTTDFVFSGWPDVLPRHATAVFALVALATRNDVDGSLDALVAVAGCGWFDPHTGGLDSAVSWIHPDDTDDPESVADAARTRAKCHSAFAQKGLVVPATVRELAQSMTTLRILRTNPTGTSWRLAPNMPLPAEVLAISQEIRHAEDQRRWSTLQERTALYLSRHLAVVGAGRTPVTTSVARLGVAVDRDDDSVRAALEVLVRYGAVVLRLDDGTNADPERLLATTPIIASELLFDEIVPVEDP